MARWPRWRHTLEAAKEEAAEAVEHYNGASRGRAVEGFVVHMHVAWLYLLQAKFQREAVDMRYRLANGRIDRIDGEPRLWDLARCIREHLPDDRDPVRKNVELWIRLRNRIEHRHARAFAVATQGKAQALLVNFERALTSTFGDEHSLADIIRFPVFISGLDGDPAAAQAVIASLPSATRNVIARFEADLGGEILGDQRYDLQVTLTPRLGAATGAVSALDFRRLDEMSQEEIDRARLAGRAGTVIVRERARPIVHHEHMRPGEAAAEIEDQLPFRFSVYSHFPRAWKQLQARPPTNDDHPERTDERYCVYDAAHRDYVYTDAFVAKVVRSTNTEEKFLEFTGIAPVRKLTRISSTDRTAS